MLLEIWQSRWLRHIVWIFEGSRRTRRTGRMIDAIFTFPASTGIVTEVGVVIFLGSGSGGRPIVGRTMVMPRRRRIRRIGLHFVATLGTLLLFGGGSIGGRRRSWGVISGIYRGKTGRLGEDVGARRERLRTGDGATRITRVARAVERMRWPVAMTLLLLLLVFLALLRWLLGRKRRWLRNRHRRRRGRKRRRRRSGGLFAVGDLTGFGQDQVIVLVVFLTERDQRRFAGHGRFLSL